MRGRWYRYRGRGVWARNKEEANRRMGSPLPYNRLAGIKKARQRGKGPL